MATARFRELPLVVLSWDSCLCALPSTPSLLKKLVQFNNNLANIKQIVFAYHFHRQMNLTEKADGVMVGWQMITPPISSPCSFLLHITVLVTLLNLLPGPAAVKLRGGKKRVQPPGWKEGIQNACNKKYCCDAGGMNPFTAGCKRWRGVEDSQGPGYMHFCLLQCHCQLQILCQNLFSPIPVSMLTTGHCFPGGFRAPL